MPAARPESTWTKPAPWCREPALWSAYDGGSAEVEVGDFLWGLVRLTKPELVVETGTHFGLTARRIAEGLRANGRGRLLTLEPNGTFAAAARAELAGLPAEVVQADSRRWEPPGRIGLLFADSELEIRHQEIERFRPWMLPEGERRSLVVVHDTGPQHPVTGYLAPLEAAGKIRGLNFRTPRGLWFGEVY